VALSIEINLLKLNSTGVHKVITSQKWKVIIMAKKKENENKEYIKPVTKHYHEKTVHVSGYYRKKPTHHKKHKR